MTLFPRRSCLAALALAFALLACAPLRQQPLPLNPPLAPRFTERALIASDGAELGLSVWRPVGVEPWAVIVALHGMNDYAGAFRLAGPWWAERGVATYAVDLRGFGRSPNRGVWPERELLLQDVRDAVAAARRAHPQAQVALLGLSMGAAAAIVAETSEAPPGADALVLVSPAVWGWSNLPWLYAASLRLAAAFAPGAELEPPKQVLRQVTPTDNLPFLIAMGQDSNLLFETRVDALLGLVNLMEIASQRVGALPAPGRTLHLVGSRDEIIPPVAAERAIAHLPAGATVVRYEAGYHLLLSDLQAERVWRDVLSFLSETERKEEVY